jgi:hypothetical protein
LESELFTTESVLSLAGATGMVTIGSNALHYGFKFNPRISGIILSFVLSVTILVINSSYRFEDVIIGLFNGLLIYSTAVGAAQMTGKEEISKTSQRVYRLTDSRKFPKSRGKFFVKWY